MDPALTSRSRTPGSRQTWWRAGWLAVAVAAFGFAAAAAAWFVDALDVTDGPGAAPSAAVVSMETRTGTTGDLGGPPIATLGTWITDIRSLGGREDLSEYIGRQVRLVVDSGALTNDVAFWIGSPPDDLLVVISRGDRTAADRQLGNPSTSDIGSPPPGAVTIGGTIQPVPYAEATYSWGLTRRDVDLLAERGVYVEATDVISAAPDIPGEGLTAEGVDEAGRETAPPPGDEVDTPLRVPPPSP